MSKAELIASRIAKAQQLGQDLPLLASCSDGHMVDDTILSGVLAPIFVTMPSPSQDMVNGQPVSEVVPSAYQEPHSANYFYTEHPLTTHGPTGYAPEQTNAGIDTVAEPDVLFTTSSTVSGSFQYPPGLSSSISFNATSTPGSTCPPTSQYHSADHLYGQVIQSTSQSHMSPGLCPLEYSADYADTIAFDEVADLSLCGYPEMSSGDFYDQQPQRSSSTGSHVQNELLYGYPVLAETTNFASTAQQNYFHDPTPPFHLAQCNNNAQEFEAQIYTSSYC
ncbi:hypothetical protein CERSUDRAFT_89927 [Gelatoporia subvermispora B]|uniref:Uncharacterized protein n=1 Tax=Ceriporiopsis subvermispora (strain B) TaxID=914234 RepID=M2RSE7_CERS8|nr:hypothetical protein CERSUDRAFT_89927 [Gelatoporia subvermispora B]